MEEILNFLQHNAAPIILSLIIVLIIYILVSIIITKDIKRKLKDNEIVINVLNSKLTSLSNSNIEMTEEISKKTEALAKITIERDELKKKYDVLMEEHIAGKKLLESLEQEKYEASLENKVLLKSLRHIIYDNDDAPSKRSNKELEVEPETKVEVATPEETPDPNVAKVEKVSTPTETIETVDNKSDDKYASMSRQELFEAAKNAGIKNYILMSNDKIIKALTEKE